MSIQISEISDKDTLETYLLKQQHTPFLQSYEWGDFQEKIGNKVYRFGIFDGEYLVGIFSAFQIKAKYNSYLYIPWGPMLSVWKEVLVKEMTDKLIEIAKKENLDFVRLEPRVINESDIETLEKVGFRQSKSFTQPECTAIIDLSKSEEELLSAMSDSTRYNIRNVERKGVQIRKGGIKDIDTFERLLKETAERHKFTTDIHSNYYKNQYETLHEEGIIDVFVAEFEKEPLAVSLVTFFGDTATYLHAASSRNQPKLRAPYLLVWKSILEGKSRGHKYFDFWGVSPVNALSSHPWSGVTSFKLSFGAERVCYAPVFDYPTSNKYLLAKFIEVARKPAKKILRF